MLIIYFVHTYFSETFQNGGDGADLESQPLWQFKETKFERVGWGKDKSLLWMTQIVN